MAVLQASIPAALQVQALAGHRGRREAAGVAGVAGCRGLAGTPLLVQPLAVGLLPLLLRLLEVALGSGARAGQRRPQALQQRGLRARAA